MMVAALIYIVVIIGAVWGVSQYLERDRYTGLGWELPVEEEDKVELS